ncbi:MAG: hypothetical protein WCT49_05230 [Candidatus Paceibacterota bacterium]|jgi:hypothetical protein|nr:hypothetical protein [Candidatus Paceibacterota bacterium]
MHKFTDKTGKIYIFFMSLAISLFAFSAFASRPSVQTTSVAAVSGSCAALQGYANTNNTAGYSRWFELKELNKNMKPVTVGQSGSWFGFGGGNNNTGYYQSEAKALTPDTDYVYRAVAQNNEGIAYGQEVSFRTKSLEYVSDSFNGCSEYVPMTTNRNVIFNVDTGAVIPAGPSSLSQGSQNYTYQNQTPLYSSPQYNYNAAANSHHSVTSLPATNVGNTTATLNARANATQNTLQYGRFIWGRSAGNLANTTPRVALGSGASLYLSQQISGLTPGTTYYYKPVVDDQFGAVEGALYSFTTSGTAPTSSGQSSSYVDSGQIAYNSTPVKGGVVVSTTNPLPKHDTTASAGKKTDVLADNRAISAGDNTAAAALASRSFSIFPKTFEDWFTIITLLFLFVMAYFLWNFYMQKKEEALEYAGVPNILATPEDVPQKPIKADVHPRKYVKDPFYGSNKEPLSEVLPIKDQETPVGLDVNTTKGAPPDNLPV